MSDFHGHFQPPPKLALAALSSNDFFEKVPIPWRPSRKTKRKHNRGV
jgi:hypothetical protein